ncbi:hypothetical protein CHGG_09420 [Chaetomium globosum CBS 148.51]|uniref:Zn(2)-C6 fungal-type domain-containing protein n=1 Tax=Chaetomium globosum (strain ATCC 6205 / CBS 148.51 / DSM 1962 / NBRC 6347 / NRRL 1970) TaxID=306901 RepID=Q2GRI4_CHAGB|nr:uncharacterized protein CHGG_09420 [Chaetomium globosum CBS 148.51]EAQ85406.1 hypothetical protein CHGG_09420 [Chaetomium globosum CBS 148.51]
MSFNRRRVALACTFCRHRKRRCDATRPSCRNCIEADVDCRYDDTPSQRIDSSGGSREIISRLQDIEAMLQHHLPGISTLTSGVQAIVSQSPTLSATSPASQASTLQAARILSHDLAGAAPAAQSWPLPMHMQQQSQLSGVTDAELPPLTIPVGHKTSSNYLLRLPAMKQLIGEYPADLFFLLESRNPLPPEMPAHFGAPSMNPVPPAELSKDVLDRFVSAFLSGDDHTHPILDKDEFHRIYQGFLENYYSDPWCIESILCLVVFAFGAAKLARPGAQGFQSEPPGMVYMQAALPTLVSMSSWSVSYSLLLPQALVLASVYFAYIIRPLQSWRLVYSASSLLQFKLCRLSARDDDPAAREVILRIFWSCFLVECDRLAELELPQSGLQQLIDKTSLPSFSGVDDSQSTTCLAEISIRRLLNRVHNTLYPRKQSVLSLSSTSLTASDEFSAAETASVASICDELYRQLNSWYESIPEPSRPTLGTEPTGHDRKTILRIRYYAARHIIHRPFVLYIVTNDLPHVANAAILEKASVCIESCRIYLQNTREILAKQSQYTWTFSLS